MRVVITRRDVSLQIPDGINTFIYPLANQLLARGHEVTLIAGPGSPNGASLDLYDYEHRPSELTLSDRPKLGVGEQLRCWGGRSARALFRRLAPDLVIVNGAIPFKPPGRVCTVAHDAEDAGRQLRSSLRVAYKAFAYRRADSVVATCSEVRDELAAETRIDPDRISVIPTCVEPERYTPLPLERRERALLHLGTAGYKNPVASVRGFAESGVDDAVLYITGPRTEALTEAIEATPGDVRERIEPLGFVDDDRLRELLGRVRGVAVPSVYRTPVASPTALEAFASATPVIGTSSISRDVLRDGESGLLVDPESVQEVAAAMRRLLSGDDEWRHLSGGAMSRAGDFSAAAVADRYLELARAPG